MKIFISQPMRGKTDEQILKYIGTFPIFRPKLIQTKLQMNSNQPQRQEIEEITINVFEQIKL